MKKLSICILVMLLLSGCAAEETFETVADEIILSPMGQPREVVLELPPEAAAPASESEFGAIYQCDGYEIMVQTMESGDLQKTIHSVSGYSPENLTVVETEGEDYRRYDFVWASAGEQGDRVGRAAILDDGSYHYVLTILGDADRAKDWEEVWQQLFASFSLA